MTMQLQSDLTPGPKTPIQAKPSSPVTNRMQGTQGMESGQPGIAEKARVPVESLASMGEGGSISSTCPPELAQDDSVAGSTQRPVEQQDSTKPEA